jgi:hypothetical protein
MESNFVKALLYCLLIIRGGRLKSKVEADLFSYGVVYVTIPGELKLCCCF